MKTFYIDPMSGADLELTEEEINDPVKIQQSFESTRKFETWKKRFSMNISTTKQIELALQGSKKKMKKIDRKHLPPLLMIQVL